MGGMEFNKIFAALLVAGIVATMSGFIAKEVTHVHELEKDAIAVEGSEGGESGGPAKAQMADPILDMIAAADVAKGEKVAKVCAACHTFDQGGPMLTGPNLYGVVGHAKASHAGFSYSEDMKALGGSWSYLELNKFLWKPKSVVPGTKMTFIGIKKPEDRAALIAWLRTKGGAPLPSAAEIAAEKAELAPPEEEAPAEEAEGAAGAAPEAEESH